MQNRFGQIVRIMMPEGADGAPWHDTGAVAMGAGYYLLIWRQPARSRRGRNRNLTAFGPFRHSYGARFLHTSACALGLLPDEGDCTRDLRSAVPPPSHRRWHERRLPLAEAVQCAA